MYTPGVRYDASSAAAWGGMPATAIREQRSAKLTLRTEQGQRHLTTCFHGAVHDVRLLMLPAIFVRAVIENDPAAFRHE